jgi:hypothetical protein
VRLACLAVLVMLAVGLWAMMPYLTAEHSRLEPWKIVELWCVNILALIWFARFAIVHAVQAEPLLAVPFEDGRRQIRLVRIAGITALLVESVLTFSLMYDERVRFAKAVVTDARVVAVREIIRAVETWFEVDCRFQDARGTPHAAHIRVEADKNILPAALPPETAKVLRSHAHGSDRILIRYDPQFPARAWAEGAGWDDGQKIYWFSLLTLFFQAMITALFLLLLAKHSAGGFLPWWWDIYKVLPLFAAGFWLFAMGIIDRLLD